MNNETSTFITARIARWIGLGYTDLQTVYNETRENNQDMNEYDALYYALGEIDDRNAMVEEMAEIDSDVLLNGSWSVL